MKCFVLAAVSLILYSIPFSALDLQQKERDRLDRIEQTLKADVPRLLCLTDSYATGGQPTEQAYSKLASNGFRSVLNLRTATEGVDLEKERAAVEQSGMRYLSIPIVGSAPRAEQAEEFVRVVKEKANQPMLIHCGSGNRVGAFMMIYRVVEQGWREEDALEEAVKIGLRSEDLKKFARDYIAQQKKAKSG